MPGCNLYAINLEIKVETVRASISSISSHFAQETGACEQQPQLFMWADPLHVNTNGVSQKSRVFNPLSGFLDLATYPVAALDSRPFWPVAALPTPETKNKVVYGLPEALWM